jgi:hypothetical protein
VRSDVFQRVTNDSKTRASAGLRSRALPRRLAGRMASGPAGRVLSRAVLTSQSCEGLRTLAGDALPGALQIVQTR